MDEAEEGAVRKPVKRFKSLFDEQEWVEAEIKRLKKRWLSLDMRLAKEARKRS